MNLFESEHPAREEERGNIYERDSATDITFIFFGLELALVFVDRRGAVL
jgi:hypothetical protein